MKFFSIMTRGDIIRLSILLLVAASAFLWLWIEFQKPLLPAGTPLF